MKKDISVDAFLLKAKETAYMIVFSAIAFLVIAVLTTLGS